MPYEKAKVTIDLDEYISLRHASGDSLDLFSLVDAEEIVSMIKSGFTDELLRNECIEQLRYTQEPSQRKQIADIYQNAAMNTRNRIIDLINSKKRK
jgi:hypothetical protein